MAAYIAEVNLNFELLEVIKKAQRAVEEENASDNALILREKSAITAMQQAIEKERESNSTYEAKLRREWEEMQQSHSYAELNRRSSLSSAKVAQRRYNTTPLLVNVQSKTKQYSETRVA